MDSVHKVVAMAVGVVVAIMLFASLVVPIAAEAQDQHRTIHNEIVGGGHGNVVELADGNDTKDLTKNIVINMGTQSVVVDGQLQEFNSISNWALISSGCSLILGIDHSLISSAAYIDPTHSNVVLRPATAVGSTITVNISGGSISIDYAPVGEDGQHFSVPSYEWIAYPDINGNYKMIDQNTYNDVTVTVNSPDQIYGYTWLGTKASGCAWHGDTATLTDGTTYKMVGPEKVDGYTDRYDFKAIGGWYVDPNQLTNANGSHISPYRYLVPETVTVHAESDAAVNAMISILPLLFAVVIVVAVAGYIRDRHE